MTFEPQRHNNVAFVTLDIHAPTDYRDCKARRTKLVARSYFCLRLKLIQNGPEGNSRAVRGNCVITAYAHEHEVAH